MAGFNYSSLMTQLANTKLQKSSPSLYQTIQNLINGTQDATTTLNEEFTGINGEQTTLSQGVSSTFDSINASISALVTDLDTLVTEVDDADQLGIVHIVECGSLTSITPDGTLQVIKDSAGTAGTTNITINATVDGVVNPKITTNYGVFRVYKSPSNGNFYTW